METYRDIRRQTRKMKKAKEKLAVQAHQGGRENKEPRSTS